MTGVRAEIWNRDEAGLLTIRPRRYVRVKKRLLGSIVTQNGNMLLATNL
jgi:hypothetical protein